MQWLARFSVLMMLCASALAETQIEEVSITGERAGPRLWRVSNGDHVVWLLGTLDPLPKDMTWRSRELESVLGEVDQVLPSEPDVDLKAGPITLARLYFQWRRVRNIPDKGTLKDWLSPELYARWTVLKTRYGVRDKDFDRQLPMLAAARLYRQALRVSGLASDVGVERAVMKLARKHKVRVTRTDLKVEKPRDILAQLAEIPREAQVACLEAMVERLENDIETMKAQARAWALGDVQMSRAADLGRHERPDRRGDAKLGFRGRRRAEYQPPYPGRAAHL
jgi:uncharacterized protein YbaP (TraB family)